MENQKIPEWKDLGSAVKEQYTDHAAYLIKNGYVLEKDIDKLAEKIYKEKVKTLLANTTIKEHRGIISLG